MRSNARYVLAGILIASLPLLAGLTGCESWGKKKTLEPVKDDIAPTEAEKRLSGIMGDTVGGVAYLQGTRWQAVRGYGLVVGLGRNGSKICPEPLRKQMLQEIRKRLEKDGIYSLSQIEVHAKDLMDNTDTSVVEVTGLIPPGACKGTRFDVHVQAVAGTDTKSLEGGKLYTCGLHIYTMDDQGDIVTGKSVAEASGPIFQNFAVAGSPTTQPDPRRGLVLGGGRNTVARSMDITLSTASQRIARQITNRINEEYGAGQEIAKAQNTSHIQVSAPPGWQNKEEHFYELVMHLPLQREQAYLTGRAKNLLARLAQPDALSEDIALVLEAMGQPVVPVVQDSYADANRATRYYAARVGLRLRDDTAVDVLGHEAMDRGSPFREAAVAELANADDVAVARIPLRDLVDDSNVKIRILAYEGLARHLDEMVTRYRVGHTAFTLDVVPCKGEPLIYATRALEPRVAILGKNVSCRPPFFYMHPSKVVTVEADYGQHEATLVRRTPYGQVSEPFKEPLLLADMVRFMGELAEVDDNTGKVKGLELSYSQVLEVIQALCTSKAVPATLQMQTATLSDSLGVIKPMNRPESEIPR